MHEKSHRQTHKCIDCDIKPCGFNSASALRKHRETYHMKPEDFTVPESLVRSLTALSMASDSSIVTVFVQRLHNMGIAQPPPPAPAPAPSIVPPQPDPNALSQLSSLNETDVSIMIVICDYMISTMCL